ncbi:hypothetical protein MS3_00006032 [Schistosoma haematobium]|uniref:Egg protein CP391S-like protein n=1 Tax=Schistosoma haematobium TaxID=6185 RepID=A0A922IQL4_SCHHA|nr:hypothetical protein MS3_00006032 [Schistosoma haematobium]KAH9584425.1 hypothetical protein MS3_00006032 [Schistosoma haematobium]
MSFFLIIICVAEFFECQDVCNQTGWMTSGKIISENSSYRYSQHYMYLQSISINQTQPSVITSLDKYNKTLFLEPQLSLKFYNSNVTRFDIYTDSGIDIHGEQYVGYIEAFNAKNISFEFAILNKKDLFAVKWFIDKEVDGKQFTAEVTCLIHPNGKIVFYYDKVSTEIKTIDWKPKIGCGGTPQIVTPETWINSGTMVEYELIGDYCPKYTSPEACQNATTSDITCFWCDKVKLCIDSTDKDAHNMKVNKCRVKHNPDVNDLSTQTPTKHIETTSSAGEFPVTESPKGTTEETNQHSNTTTEENVEKKSLWYLYIVIPLVIIFFVVCVGLIIWRWLHQRK